MSVFIRRPVDLRKAFAVRPTKTLRFRGFTFGKWAIGVLKYDDKTDYSREGDK